MASKPRIALCLSGGGYRATIFHLGALRRLNELGVLSRLDTISSVSGGSIAAGMVAARVVHWPAPGQPIADWEKLVEAPIRALTRRDLRTGPILKRAWPPAHWFQPHVSVAALEREYAPFFTNRRLIDMPASPNFVLCGTDMKHGVNWVFERRRVGSYKTGYLQPGKDWPIARAVAASSCFPPIFAPMKIHVHESDKLKVRTAAAAESDFNRLLVTDGGVYDNLGLEPANRHDVILCSDGGLPFNPSLPQNFRQRMQAYTNIMANQTTSLRKRELINCFKRGEKWTAALAGSRAAIAGTLAAANGQPPERPYAGTYWGIASSVESYDRLPVGTPRDDSRWGYTKKLASKRIACIRTDLDAFSDLEFQVLMNHGYTLAECALRVHVPTLYSASASPMSIPFPNMRNEPRLCPVLKESAKRNWLGRKK